MTGRVSSCDSPISEAFHDLTRRATLAGLTNATSSAEDLLWIIAMLHDVLPAMDTIGDGRRPYVTFMPNATTTAK
jgi:hypothetical protein